MKNTHTNTKKYERYELIPWKKAAKKAQQCCYISKRTDQLEVHHAGKSFADIFNEAHKILNLEYHKNVEDYEPKDLDALTETILELHVESVPVVLHKDVHLALHRKFGQHVDLNQIEEFKRNFDKGGNKQ
jgi:hypothetical protein